MKGIVFMGERKVELMDFPDPEHSPRDVVLEIKASGMCGTDLGPYRRKYKPGMTTSGVSRVDGHVIGGHEPCGVVAAVGTAVSEQEVKVGDRVMDHHYDGCGTCRHCQSGWSQMCLDGAVVFGSGGHGAHAKYMSVPAHTLVPLPDDISFEAGGRDFLRYRYGIQRTQAPRPRGRRDHRCFRPRPCWPLRHAARRGDGCPCDCRRYLCRA